MDGNEIGERRGLSADPVVALQMRIEGLSTKLPPVFDHVKRLGADDHEFVEDRMSDFWLGQRKRLNDQLALSANETDRTPVSRRLQALESADRGQVGPLFGEVCFETQNLIFPLTTEKVQEAISDLAQSGIPGINMKDTTHAIIDLLPLRDGITLVGTWDNKLMVIARECFDSYKEILKVLDLSTLPKRYNSFLDAVSNKMKNCANHLVAMAAIQEIGSIQRRLQEDEGAEIPDIEPEEVPHGSN